MGSDTSKTTIVNENDQLYINESTMNQFNSIVNSTVSDTLIKSNAQCSNVTLVDQQLDIVGCSISNTNLNYVSGANVTVDFSCINTLAVENDIAQEMYSEMATLMANNLDADSINTMDTNAETSASSYGFNINDVDADTDVENIYKLTSVNKTTTNIENTIANTITSNLDVDSIQSCVDEQAINQSITIADCDINNSNVNLTQNAAIDITTECMNQSEVSQMVSNGLEQDLGVIVESGSDIDSTSDITNKIKTSATSVGFSAGMLSSILCIIILFIIFRFGGTTVQSIMKNPLTIFICCIALVAIVLISTVTIG